MGTTVEGIALLSALSLPAIVDARRASQTPAPQPGRNAEDVEESTPAKESRRGKAEPYRTPSYRTRKRQGAVRERRSHANAASVDGQNDDHLIALERVQSGAIHLTDP